MKLPGMVLSLSAMLMSICVHGLTVEQPFRLPALPDHLPHVIWSSTCQAPDGFTLAYGGEDQHAADGNFHTHVKSAGVDSGLQDLTARLRAGNPLQVLHDRIWRARTEMKDALARIRFAYLDGVTSAEMQAGDHTPELALSNQLVAITTVMAECSQPRAELTHYQQHQLDHAIGHLVTAASTVTDVLSTLTDTVNADSVSVLFHAQVELEQAAAALDAEPGPRALSPLVYDDQSRLFILFGGDHLDFLTNDTWTFDPKQQVWQQRHPHGAPPPRANHRLMVAAGRITLSGGYTYSNNTDYMGGPYVNIADGDWIYDVAADTWTASGSGQPIADDSRTYRSGAFHPKFFLRGDKPDAPTITARLRDIPSNTWLPMDCSAQIRHRAYCAEFLCVQSPGDSDDAHAAQLTPLRSPALSPASAAPWTACRFSRGSLPPPFWPSKTKRSSPRSRTCEPRSLISVSRSPRGRRCASPINGAKDSLERPVELAGNESVRSPPSPRQPPSVAGIV